MSLEAILVEGNESFESFTQTSLIPIENDLEHPYLTKLNAGFHQIDEIYFEESEKKQKQKINLIRELNKEFKNKLPKKKEELKKIIEILGWQNLTNINAHSTENTLGTKNIRGGISPLFGLDKPTTSVESFQKKVLQISYTDNSSIFDYLKDVYKINPDNQEELNQGLEALLKDIHNSNGSNKSNKLLADSFKNKNGFIEFQKRFIEYLNWQNLTNINTESTENTLGTNNIGCRISPLFGLDKSTKTVATFQKKVLQISYTDNSSIFDYLRDAYKINPDNQEELNQGLEVLLKDLNNSGSPNKSNKLLADSFKNKNGFIGFQKKFIEYLNWKNLANINSLSTENNLGTRSIGSGISPLFGLNKSTTSVESFQKKVLQISSVNNSSIFDYLRDAYKINPDNQEELNQGLEALLKDMPNSGTNKSNKLLADSFKNKTDFIGFQKKFIEYLLLNDHRKKIIKVLKKFGINMEKTNYTDSNIPEIFKIKSKRKFNNKKKQKLDDKIGEFFSKSNGIPINFLKGNAFEQLVGIYLSYEKENELIIPQYCLNVNDESGYFGNRVDFKVGNCVYEVKWGLAEQNIDETIKKQKPFAQKKGLEYRLICQKNGKELEVPKDKFKDLAKKSSLEKILLDVNGIICDLSKEDSNENRLRMEAINDYLYDIIQKANSKKTEERKEYIQGEMRRFLSEKTIDDRINYAKSQIKYFFSPLEAFFEYGGKLYNNFITINEYHKEGNEDFEKIYTFGQMKFKSQKDRNLAVSLEYLTGKRIETMLIAPSKIQESGVIFKTVEDQGKEICYSTRNDDLNHYRVENLDEIFEIYDATNKQRKFLNNYIGIEDK